MTCIRCHEREARGLVCGPCLSDGAARLAGISQPTTSRSHIGSSGTLELPSDALEAVVQSAVIDRLASFGFKCWRVGQRDARGTQDPGPSDAIAIHERLPVIAFVEVKRVTGGVQSEAQREFQAWVERAGGIYLLANDPSVIEAWWRAMSETDVAA